MRHQLRPAFYSKIICPLSLYPIFACSHSHIPFFNIEAHAAKFMPMIDTQVKFYAQINCEVFQSDLARIHKKERVSPERSIFDTVLMFKRSVLQHLYNMANEGIEYLIRDRLFVHRFSGAAIVKTRYADNTYRSMA